MLVRLLPEQISSLWDIVKYAVEQSLPPVAYESPDKMNRVLSSLLAGKTQCWASYTRNPEVKFEGLVLTKMIYDDVSNTKNLLIYCLYGYEDVDDKSWFSGLNTLSKYAKSKGCAQVMAYTDRPGVVKLVKRLGGDTSFTFISFDVKKIVQKLNDLGGE